MRCVTSFMLVLIVLARTTAAQTAQQPLAALAAEVPPGEKIVVVTTDGAKISGRLRTLTTDALALDTRHGLETLPATRIDRVVVKDSVRNGFWIGLGVGAAAGLAGGLLVNAICVNETGSCPGAVLGLTAIGAAAGAGIGAGADGLRHRTVFNTMAPVPAESAPHVAVNLALGQSDAQGISGGPQIALTPQVSLRPDVSIFKTAVWTHIQAGLGLRVGW